jgi:hypothetical protein
MVAGQLALITAALFAGAAVYISRPRKWRLLELTNGVAGPKRLSTRKLQVR